MLCEHGCGQEAKFVTKFGKKNVCSIVHMQCSATKARWQAAWTKKKEDGWIHPGRGKTKFVNGKLKRLSDEEIFKVHDNDSPENITRSDFLKRELLRRGFVSSLNKCSKCSTEEWLGLPMLTDLHHKNGNDKDCRRENLEIICPNCHRYTDTYAVNKGKKKNGQL